MNLHQWLRTFLAINECGVVVLDTVWTCTALHPRATKAYIMESLQAVLEDSGSFLIKLPTAKRLAYFDLCDEISPHDHAHCVCLLNNCRVMSQIDTKFHDSQTCTYGPNVYFQPSNSGSLLYSGLWLQRVVELALINNVKPDGPFLKMDTKWIPTFPIQQNTE